MQFSDTSHIELFPLLIRPFGEDNFRVLRWGGNAKVLTRKFGVDAIYLLRKGRTVGEVRRALAEQSGAEPSRVDLGPLLQALLRAGLVRRVDGHAVRPRSQVTLSRATWFTWRFYLSPLLRKLSTFLPLAVCRRLSFWIRFFDLRKAMKPAVEAAGRNLATVWPEKPAGEIAKLQNEFYRHWIWNLVDIDIFETRKLRALDQWMNRQTTIDGIEHLNRARDGKQGVILCVFHFNSTRLIPILLMRQGYPVAAIGPATMGWGMGKTREVLKKFRDLSLAYAPLRLFGDFTLENLQALAGALKNGEVATCMADVIPGPSLDQDPETQERMRYFRLTNGQDFPRASAPIRFLGHRVDMTPWVGWLAEITGATVLPTIMLRQSDHHLQLRIGPPVIPRGGQKGGKTYRKQEINAALYHALEDYVTEYPGQWFAWHNLHRVGLERAVASMSIPLRRAEQAGGNGLLATHASGPATSAARAARISSLGTPSQGRR